MLVYGKLDTVKKKQKNKTRKTGINHMLADTKEEMKPKSFCAFLAYFRRVAKMSKTYTVAKNS